MHRSPLFATLVFATLVLLCAAAAASAATLTYPGAAPCNTTLQACVTGASPGDTVQIATNTPITENITALQPLTLTAAAGFTPVLNGSAQLQGNGASPTSSTISNLTVNGTISAKQIGTGDFDVHIVGNTVNISDRFANAIELDSFQSPPTDQVTFDVSNNVVNVTGGSASDQCRGIFQGGLPSSGSGTSSIVGNRLTVTDCGEGSAIVVDVNPGDALSTDILRNYVVATNTNDGILVRNPADSATPTGLAARIIDNVVTGETAQAGAADAIAVDARNGQPIIVQVVNNTVAFNENGIFVTGRSDLGGTVSGVVANNIVADNTLSGLFIGTDFQATVSNDHNLVFNNGFDGFVAGPGTVIADPLFVSNTDFHLQATSPAINAGNNVRVPPDITTDIEGNPRIQNGQVDIGAYESPFALSATAVPALSTASLLLLVALLAIAGWALGRRT